jgi:hypothetical protein
MRNPAIGSLDAVNPQVVLAAQKGIAAKQNPKKALPTSPMKTLAGGQFWIRKPMAEEANNTPAAAKKGLPAMIPMTSQPRAAVTVWGSGQSIYAVHEIVSVHQSDRPDYREKIPGVLERHCFPNRKAKVAPPARGQNDHQGGSGMNG